MLSISACEVARVNYVGAGLILTTYLRLVLCREVHYNSLRNVRVNGDVLTPVIDVTNGNGMHLIILRPINGHAFVFLRLSEGRDRMSTIVCVVIPIVFRNGFDLLILNMGRRTQDVSIGTIRRIDLAILANLIRMVVRCTLCVRDEVANDRARGTCILFGSSRVAVLVSGLGVATLRSVLILLNLTRTRLRAEFRNVIGLNSNLSVRLSSPTLRDLLRLNLTEAFRIFRRPFRRLHELLRPMIIMFVEVSMTVDVINILAGVSFSVLLSRILGPVSYFKFVFYSWRSGQEVDPC